MFFIDAYGGWESHQPMQEHRKIKEGFTYVWDQDEVCPIDNGVVNYIHFEFKDGSKLKNAFTYEWRLWTLPAEETKTTSVNMAMQNVRLRK